MYNYRLYRSYENCRRPGVAILDMQMSKVPIISGYAASNSSCIFKTELSSTIYNNIACTYFFNLQKWSFTCQEHSPNMEHTIGHAQTIRIMTWQPPCQEYSPHTAHTIVHAQIIRIMTWQTPFRGHLLFHYLECVLGRSVGRALRTVITTLRRQSKL